MIENDPAERDFVTAQIRRLAEEIAAGRLPREFVDRQILRRLLMEGDETRLVVVTNFSPDFNGLRNAVTRFGDAYLAKWGEWSPVVGAVTPLGRTMLPNIFGGLYEGRMSGTRLRIAIDGELTQP